MSMSVSISERVERKNFSNPLTGFLLVVVFLAFYCEPLMADNAGFYFSMMSSKTFVDSDELPQEETGDTGVQYYFGWAFDNKKSLELDITFGNSGDLAYAVDSFGLFGVYRSASKRFYYLGKVGINTVSIELPITVGFSSIDANSQSTTGLAFGVGGGIKLSPSFRVETDYVIRSSELRTLGVGVSYVF